MRAYRNRTLTIEIPWIIQMDFFGILWDSLGFFGEVSPREKKAFGVNNVTQTTGKLLGKKIYNIINLRPTWHIIFFKPIWCFRYDCLAIFKKWTLLKKLCTFGQYGSFFKWTHFLTTFAALKESKIEWNNPRGSYHWKCSFTLFMNISDFYCSIQLD